MPPRDYSFDATIKSIFQAVPRRLLHALGLEGDLVPVEVEFHNAHQRRLDTLYRTGSGSLCQIEFQATNDPRMDLRMLEYGTLVLRHKGQFPLQIVIYVGKERLRMPSKLHMGALRYSYRLVDIRSLRADDLLASPHWPDQILAVLAHSDDPEQVLRQVLRSIQSDPALFEDLFGRLLVLCKLRDVEAELPLEEVDMRIDFLKHPGTREHALRLIEEGVEKGVVQGKQAGKRDLLRKMLEAKFTTLPRWAESRLRALSTEQIDSVAERLLTAESVRDAFGDLAPKRSR